MAPQKKYICAFCARAFSRSEHKQRHERSHTNEKPFHCQYCTSAFVRRDLLQRHCRTVHNVNMVPNSANKRKTSNGATPTNSGSNTGSAIGTATGSISSPVSPEEEDVAEDVHQPHLQQYSQPQAPFNHSAHQYGQMQQPLNMPSNENVVAQPINVAEQIFSNYGTPMGSSTGTGATTTSTSHSSYSKSASSSNLEKKIVQSLSLSKKLSFVLSNYEKISFLQARDIPKIHYIASNFNSLLPLDMNISNPLDNYYLSWNISNKFKLPIIDTLASEIDEFIESFSNLTSTSLITKFYSKFNEYTDELQLSAVDNQKILNIECKICLLYAILSIGAAMYNDGEDCVQLFMRSWNLLLTNLIPRLNNNTKSVDSSAEEAKLASSSSAPYSSDIIKDQIQILKNLFTLGYVCFNLDLNLKEISCSSLNEDLIFNYLDDISFIIMSHLEENNNVNHYNMNKLKSSRCSSSSSLNSPEMLTHADNLPPQLSASISEASGGELPHSFSTSVDGKIIDENLDLFWSIYILLSNYFMINNHSPPKIYKFLLGKKLVDNDTLMNIMENLTKSTVSNDSKFNNEIILLTLSNELQSYIHYNEMLLYKLKSLLHNSIIFTNRSLNDLAMGHPNNSMSTADDYYVFELFKKKMIVNSPTKYQSLLNSYIFYPSQNFNWNLLYISLKEFNLENYMTSNDINHTGRGNIYHKFKFDEFFQKFFYDFDAKQDIELDYEGSDHLTKEQYTQFMKNLLPFFTKNYIGDGRRDEFSDFDGSESGGLEMKKSFVEELNRNSVINNNLGISSLPILFNYQFIKLNPDLMKWSNLTKLNNFEKKRFNYLLIEWYLTIIKLIIGLKNDSNVYVKRKQHKHYRSSLQESVESMTSATSSTSSSKNSSDNEYSLSNNYIFQCLIYIIKEVGGKVQHPNGNYYQLRDFESNLNFEKDEFKITDDVIYSILKSIDTIFQDWISMVNANSLDVLQSNGFKNMKKFVNEYIYSQLNVAKGINDNATYYKIPHSNLVNGDGSTLGLENYVLDRLNSNVLHQQDLSKLNSNPLATLLPVQAQVQPSYLFLQNVYQPIAPTSQVHMVQPPHHMMQHLPYGQLALPPLQPQGQPQISRMQLQQQQQYGQVAHQNGGQQTQTQNMLQMPGQLHALQSFKEVLLPPILPPLSNQFHYNEQLHHQLRFQFPKKLSTTQ